LLALNCPHKGEIMKRNRMEPNAPMPLRRGVCDWCGAKTPRDSMGQPRAYCGKDCRVKYNNLLATQGKAVMQMLKVWRKHRGAKGTPGEGVLGDITTRIDRILSEDRARHQSMKENTDD
jgi:hypothetical protein